MNESLDKDDKFLNRVFSEHPRGKNFEANLSSTNSLNSFLNLEEHVLKEARIHT
jgi:hypothetical protein